MKAPANKRHNKTGKPVAQKPDVKPENILSRSSFEWFYPGIILAVLLVYGKSMRFGFSPMDDTWLIADRLDFLTDIRNLPMLFSQVTLDLFYRPLLHLTFMTDALISSSGIAVYHATNVLVHALCAIALFRLFKLMGVERSSALVLCFLFAVHPINVQAVAWIPGRNDSMLALFAIMSCSCLLRYFKTRELKWLLLHIVLFVSALFTKETALFLPIVYFVLLLVFGNTFPNRIKIICAIAWTVFAASFWLIRMNVVGPTNAGQNEFGTTLMEFITGLIIQSGKSLLPVQQSVWPLSENVSLWPFIVTIVITIVLCLKFGFRNKQLAIIGLVWFVVLLAVPTWYGASSVQSVHYEHRMYLPLAGLLLFLGQIKIPVREASAKRVAIGITIVFAVISFRREDVYSGSDRYAATAVEEAPQVPLFYDMNGYALHQKGNYQLAINNFDEAIQLDSTRPMFYNHRGNAWLELKQYRNAIYNYNKVLSLVPGQGQTWYNRSIAYYSVGEYNHALSDLEKADSLGAAIQPDYANALNRAINMIELQNQFGQ